MSSGCSLEFYTCWAADSPALADSRADSTLAGYFYMFSTMLVMADIWVRMVSEVSSWAVPRLIDPLRVAGPCIGERRNRCMYRYHTSCIASSSSYLKDVILLRSLSVMLFSKTLLETPWILNELQISKNDLGCCLAFLAGDPLNCPSVLSMLNISSFNSKCSASNSGIVAVGFIPSRSSARWFLPDCLGGWILPLYCVRTIVLPVCHYSSNYLSDFALWFFQFRDQKDIMDSVGLLWPYTNRRLSLVYESALMIYLGGDNGSCLNRYLGGSDTPSQEFSQVTHQSHGTPSPQVNLFDASS
ncbi:hypothetical protein V6N13_059433 [Hibiscus sabdariffa]